MMKPTQDDTTCYDLDPMSYYLDETYTRRQDLLWPWPNVLWWNLHKTVRRVDLDPMFYCPPLLRKHGDIKSHLSVCHKNYNLGYNFCTITGRASILGIVFFVTRPFRWYHFVTLTVTFDLLKGQICCQAGDHNSLNSLVTMVVLSVCT